MRTQVLTRIYMRLSLHPVKSVDIKSVSFQVLLCKQFVLSTILSGAADNGSAMKFLFK